MPRNPVAERRSPALDVVLREPGFPRALSSEAASFSQTLVSRLLSPLACPRRFTTIFDNNGNGVIGRDEFVEYSQFLTVAVLGEIRDMSPS